MNKKGLFIFFGECFREGQHGTRLIDTAFGVENQTESSQSHVKLINRLKSLNFDIDISINTYKTKHEKTLLDFYPNVVYTNFKEGLYNCAQDALQSSIRNTMNNVDINKYSFIFLNRFDILLKDDFINMFNPELEQITYPNMMSIKDGDFNQTCICDLFVFIPCKYFNIFNNWKGLKNNVHNILHSDSVWLLVQNGLYLKDDIGFFSDKLYVANTSYMKNPLYVINCREEGPLFYSGFSNRRYIKETHTIVDI